MNCLLAGLDILQIDDVSWQEARWHIVPYGNMPTAYYVITRMLNQHSDVTYDCGSWTGTTVEGLATLSVLARVQTPTSIPKPTYERMSYECVIAS